MAASADNLQSGADGGGDNFFARKFGWIMGIHICAAAKIRTHNGGGCGFETAYGKTTIWGFKINPPFCENQSVIL